jgi:Fe-S oxidoreductase
MDLKEGGERLDNRRVDEVAASGANTLGVSCVFCMQMLENGLKARDLDKKIAVKDVVELVAESLFQNQSV